MANHAKVCTGKTLDPNEVNHLVQKLNKEFFGDLFSIDFNPTEKSWFLGYKDEVWISLTFWLSDEKEYGHTNSPSGKWEEYDEPITLSTDSCIYMVYYDIY